MRPWFCAASVSRRGVNRKYTRYTATIDTRFLSLSIYLSLSPARGFYGASTSRNNRLAGGCVSNRIPGQLLRPRGEFCGNVVIDSVLQAGESAKETTDIQMRWGEYACSIKRRPESLSHCLFKKEDRGSGYDGENWGDIRSRNYSWQILKGGLEFCYFLVVVFYFVVWLLIKYDIYDEVKWVVSWNWEERIMEGKIKIDKSRFGNLSVVSFLKMELCKRVNAEWYLDCVL